MVPIPAPLRISLLLDGVYLKNAPRWADTTASVAVHQRRNLLVSRGLETLDLANTSTLHLDLYFLRLSTSLMLSSCFQPIRILPTPIDAARSCKTSCSSYALQYHKTFRAWKPSSQPIAVAFNVEEKEAEHENEEKEEERPKLRWPDISPNITDFQKQAISQLPPKMTKRCKVLAKRIICLSHLDGDGNLSQLLMAWVKIMKPGRADWLYVLRELKRLEIPTLLEVTEFALLEESFEANIRDYTKIINAYAKQNRLQDAENALIAMKSRGFACDQVTLTVVIHMYSKAGNFVRADETFEEMKLLGLPLDKRAYGSMIMAYIRAGMMDHGERLLREMEAQDVYAGKEVYKALLRAYSAVGDSSGAQRVFDALQFAGIPPDARICAVLMNAYSMAGQSDKARSVLENLRKAGLEPNDKCVAVMLGAYEKENNLNRALALLIDLERHGFAIGKEASQVLAKWFRQLGVVNEVEHVLGEFSDE